MRFLPVKVRNYASSLFNKIITDFSSCLTLVCSLTCNKVSVSDIRLNLTSRSSGESVLKLGVWLTSNSQGLASLSINISKPKTSKQMLFS